MTNQEAIEDIEKSLEYGVPDSIEKETLVLSKSALEKQIPKKINNMSVIKAFPMSVHGDCPVCGSKNLSSADTDYCNACGQKLDWNEQESSLFGEE